MNRLISLILKKSPTVLRSECFRKGPAVLIPKANIGISFLRMCSSLTQKFEKAKERLNTLKDDPGNDIKLQIYGLFKQATNGPCTTKRPSSMNFVAAAKWDAWDTLGSMSQTEAQQKYIDLVNDLSKDQSSPEEPQVPGGQYEGLTFVVDDKITRITFNRPQKKNAITVQMYQDISEALKEAGNNSTSITVLTGQGDYYSSGNDLSNFQAVSGDIPTMAKNAAELLKNFVASFIDFPKPLIAAVNGPAVGIPVTLLGLCDAVYASDKATFYTPFSLLGQSPEACATYTFPKIMGYTKANEMLMFNKKIGAIEAKQVGLVTEVFPHAEFHNELEKCAKAITSASKNSMIYSKQLIRDIERETLHRVNDAECKRLEERWQSPDCMQAIMEFFQKKNKL